MWYNEKEEGGAEAPALHVHLPVPQLPLGHKDQQAQVGEYQNDQDDIFQFGPLHLLTPLYAPLWVAAQEALTVSPPLSE